MGAELAFAIDAAEAAGRVLMDHYERLERVTYKSARDVVTEADHLSEELVIRAIRERFPGDAILAEESGSHDGRRGGGDGPAHGGRDRQHRRAGVGHRPARRHRQLRQRAADVLRLDRLRRRRPAGRRRRPRPDPGRAVRRDGDGPATLNGRPIRASTKDQLIDYVISLALAGRSVSSRARAIRKAVRVPRSMGSASLGLAYVGNGRFDAFVQESGLSAWDIAAAGLIAERAGADGHRVRRVRAGTTRRGRPGRRARRRAAGVPRPAPRARDRSRAGRDAGRG